ncbi:MAG TPA: TatD family hydrolase [Anaerolineae bacterium]|nr:TatD family hydrolase [Anaerolineae bacterium]
MLVDTHCHLDFERFEEDLEAVVARAVAVGVTRMVVPALDMGNNPKVLRLAERFEEIYVAVGIHPNSSADWDDSWLKEIEGWAGEAKVVAIGEIGLDYYWDKSPPATQKRALAAQMELAASLNLPVILHNRESSEDIVAMMADSSLAGRAEAGVMHSFSAPMAIAERVVDLGFYLGFTGPVTYKKATELREVVAAIPGERILVETDAPFLSPHPYRGKRNEPAYVVEVAKRIAMVRGMDEGEVAEATTANAQRLFGGLGL